jgi:hypothetical protein
MERLNTYSKAWQSAWSSMSYAEWQALRSSVDPSQPYQILILKRASLNVMLENLNAIRSEANRYYAAFNSVVDKVNGLEDELAALQTKADAYRQFIANNPGMVPDFEFDEYSKVTDTDIPGLSKRITFADDGISVLETEAFIEFLKRIIYDHLCKCDPFYVAVDDCPVTNFQPDYSYKSM